MRSPARAPRSADPLLEAVQACRVYDLEQPRYLGAPIFPAHAPGFVYTLHRRHEPGTGEARSSASGAIYMSEHSGTHIDALCHQALGLSLYGGLTVGPDLQTPNGFTMLGADSIGPICARGVLLDCASQFGEHMVRERGRVNAQMLADTADAAGLTIRAGDVVLVRTANGGSWHDPSAYAQGPGIGSDASLWLAERKVLAVGADNLAWDLVGSIDPELGVTLPGHAILIVRHGIYIIENLFLEDLARDRRYEFLFVCLPLKMRGATGSPVRPVALAPG